MHAYTDGSLVSLLRMVPRLTSDGVVIRWDVLGGNRPAAISDFPRRGSDGRWLSGSTS